MTTVGLKGSVKMKSPKAKFRRKETDYLKMHDKAVASVQTQDTRISDAVVKVLERKQRMAAGLPPDGQPHVFSVGEKVNIRGSVFEIRSLGRRHMKLRLMGSK